MNSRHPVRQLLVGLALILTCSAVTGGSLEDCFDPSNLSNLSSTVNCLSDRSAEVVTLQADYLLTTSSTVAGETFAHQQTGSVRFERRPEGNRLSVVREVEQVAEMYLLYDDGSCLRYFPFTHYAQRLDNVTDRGNQTDFGRFWQPLLFHLDPGDLASMSGLAVTQWGPEKVVRPNQLTYRPDRSPEWSARLGAPKLEYWGASPDRDFVFDDDDRLQRVETTYYKRGEPRPNGSFADRKTKTTTILFDDLQQFNGATVPTTLRLTSRHPSQLADHRSSTLTLQNVRVNQTLPADAFAPAWPEDTIFLWVVNPGPAALLAAAGDPAAMVGLADYHAAAGDRATARSWIERLESTLSKQFPAPAALAEYARLASLVGWRMKGVRMFNSAIGDLEQSRKRIDDPAILQLLDEQLSRYYHERAALSETLRGNREADGPAAAAYLADKARNLGGLEAARTECAAAEFYERNGRPADAGARIQFARTRFDPATEAGRWIGACATRIANATARRDFQKARTNRGRAIRDLQLVLRDMNKEQVAADDPERLRVLDRLRRLEQYP